MKRTYLLIISLLATVHIYAQNPPRDDSGYIPADNSNTLPGQSGYINTMGRFILRQTFEAAGSFSEGLADVKFAGTKWGYIDTTGKMVIQPQFDETNSFSEGIAAVKKGCKWGYIDKTGQFVIPVQFDEAYSFSNGVAIVEVGNKSGFIDRKGRWLFAPRSNWFPHDFSDDTARFEVSTKSGSAWGYINKSGKIIIKPQFHHAEDFSEGLASVSTGGWFHSQTGEWVDVKYGYIDITGRTVIPFIFDWAGAFSKGIAHVQLNGNRGIIDKTGKFSPEQFAQIFMMKCLIKDCFSEGLAPVQLTYMGKWGFIDKEGNVIIQPQWQDASNFAYGLAPVRVTGGKYGYIDRTGKMVVEPIFDKASVFTDGLAVVTIFYERGRINEKGLWAK